MIEIVDFWESAARGLWSPSGQAVVVSVVGIVFVWSGIAKLVQLDGTALAISNLLTVRYAYRSAAFSLGLLELGLGAACLGASPLQPAVYLVTLDLLLLLFAGLIVRALAKGETFSCGCFGGSAPVGNLTFLRVVALLGVSVALTIAADAVDIERPSPVHISVAASVVSMLVLVAVVRDLWTLNAAFYDYLRTEVLAGVGQDGIAHANSDFESQRSGSEVTPRVWN